MSKYTEAQLRHAFEAFDTDKSGFIDRKELRALVVDRLKLPGATADKICKNILDTHDANHDKKLSYAEFKKGVLGGTVKC